LKSVPETILKLRKLEELSIHGNNFDHMSFIRKFLNRNS